MSELLPLYCLERCKFGKSAYVTRAVTTKGYVLVAVDYDPLAKLCFLLFKRKSKQD